MRRHASRHATPQDPDEIDDAIVISPSTEAQIVPRGVAQQPETITFDQLSRLLAAQQSATPASGAQWSPLGPLASLVSDQLTPGLADRTGWALFQWMQDRHILPGIGVIAGDVCGWGAAATEPNHPWFGSIFLGFGIAAGLAYTAIHTIRAINGEDSSLSTGAHGIGIIGAALTAFGTACITGLSYLSAGVTLLPLTAGYYAWFQNRHSRLQDQRGYLTAQTAAATPAVLGMPGGSTAAPAVIPGTVVSHEEKRVREAFEGVSVAIRDVYNFERVNQSSFRVTVRLAAAKGIGPDAIMGRRDELRSALGANQVIIQRTRAGDEVRLTVRYGEIDELAEKIPFPGITVRSIKDPIPLGPSATGEMSMLPLYRNHTVIGGTTNNGKSGVVNVVAVQIAAMEDALLVLLDNKPGELELGIYEDVAYAYSDSFEKAALILAAMVAVINVRGAILKRKRQESGVPSRGWDLADGPALVGIIDELAELFRRQKQSDINKIENPVLRRAVADMSDNYVRIMQVGRAYDVKLVVATQKPDALSTGGVKAGTDQAQNRICVPTISARLTNIVLHDGAHGENFRANELDTAGKFYMTTLAERIPVERKAFWITDEEITDHVTRYRDEQPQLDEESDDAFQSIMNGIEPETTAPSPFDDPGGAGDVQDYVNDTPARGGTGRANLRVVSRYPDDTEIEAKDLPYWELLATFGDNGATVPELTVSGRRAGHNRSLAAVRSLCAEWRTAEYVEFEKQGRDYRYWRNDDALRREQRQDA